MIFELRFITILKGKRDLPDNFRQETKSLNVKEKKKLAKSLSPTSYLRWSELVYGYFTSNPSYIDTFLSKQRRKFNTNGEDS